MSRTQLGISIGISVHSSNILIFSVICNLSCLRVTSNGVKLLQMIKNYSDLDIILCKPELMISRKFRFFSQHFSKNLRFFDGVGNFKG